MDARKSLFEELFKKIDESRSIADLYALDAIPPINYAGEFFFISYSHGDYKLIYKDIYSYQESGLSIWFDRGMKPGTDWLENAEHFISQFACKGIIIYLSPISFRSRAVFEEVRLASNYRKPLIPIVMDKGALVDGEISKAFIEGLGLEGEEAALIEKAFNSRILYLEASSPIESKISYINNARDETDLLEIIDLTDENSRYYLNSKSRARGKMLTQCNDPYCIRVKLPVEVSYIGDATFTNMANLKEIDLSRVKEIDSYAFADCRQLRQVDLSHAKYLSDSCFERSGIEKIVFPHFTTLKEAMDNYDAIDLKEAYADSDSTIEEDFETLKQEWFVPDDSALGEGELTIPNEEEDDIEPYFGKNAFASCQNLVEVSLIETYSYVPEGCFHDCLNLKKVTFNGPNEIRARAFYNCRSLESVCFDGDSAPLKRDENGGFTDVDYLLWKEKKMKVIGDSAFENCVSLKGFTFSGLLDSIGKAAFKGANIDARSVELYCTLGEQAFMHSTLRRIVFKGRITNIADEVCRGCENLEEIDFYEPSLPIGNSSFRDCPNLRKASIPNVSMGKSAFSHSGIAMVKLQDSVKEIGEYAFSNCHYLSYFHIESKELTIYSRAFYQCGWMKYLILPKEGHIRIDYRALEEAGFDHVLYNGTEEEFKSGLLKIEYCYAEANTPTFLSEEDKEEYWKEKAAEARKFESELDEIFEPKNFYFYHYSYSKPEAGKRRWRFDGYYSFPDILLYE